MTSGQFAVAIDLGTTGLKVGLVSFGGDVVWSDDAPCITTVLPGGGREQNANAWWSTISSMIGAGMASGAAAPDQIAVVGITGQWASTVPVDETGEPVGPCIMWTDSRGRGYTRERFGGRVGGYSPTALARWIKRTGGVPAPNGKGPTGQFLYLGHERPDIAAAARWYLEPVDYLAMRFTGVAAATHASMTGHWLTDNRRLDLMAYDADLVRWSGIDAAKLAPLVAESSVVGRVRDTVADDLGIRHGVPVITGLPDYATAAAGSGAVGPGEAHVMVSTTSWISCSAPAKKTNVLNEVTTGFGATPGEYVVLNNIDTAGACLDWFRRVIADGSAGGEPVTVAALIELAESVPAGSRGVVFTPWLNGSQGAISDAAARGGFHNVALDTGLAEMSRAVLEGVAVQNALLLGVVEKFVGQRLDPIRIVGGGARSDLWCQIHADALDRTLERPADPLNAGLRGAALNGAVAVGALRRVDLRDRVKVGSTFRPDPSHRALYDQLGSSLRQLHKGQRRPLRAINRARR